MSVYSELGRQLRVCWPCLLLPAFCDLRLSMSAPDVNLMRGEAWSGLRWGPDKVCNEFNTQHTAPPPLESGSPSNARPSKAVLVSAESLGLTMKQLRLPVFSRVFGFDHTSSPSPSTPTSVFKTEPPVSSLHSTLGFLSKTASTPTQAMKLLIFVQASCPLYHP
eukprot:g67453.t1